MRARFACVLALTALVGSCSWTRDYPEGWALLPEHVPRDCARFAGSYANRGEGSRLGQALLVRYLFDASPRYADATHVTFMQAAPQAWEMTAWKDGSRLVSRAFAGGKEARCEEGALVIEGPWELAGARGGIGRVDLTTSFHLADGYLVARVEERMRGLAAIVPVGFTLRHWYRFPVRKSGTGSD